MKKSVIFLAGVAVIVAGGAWFVTRLPSSPFDGVAAPEATPELIAAGEYVARAADCVACHSTPDSAPFAGGLKMATPIGAIYATNITPDPTHGIGGWSLADFDRAVRHGVLPGGERLYPAMPYPSYSKISDDDVRALYAYFTAGVQPVAQENRASDIPWPLNMRWPLAAWNAVFAPDTPYQAVAGQSEEWNRGAYLVEGAGHCGSCHTPRSIAFNEKGMDGASAAFLSGAALDGWYAPSLRGDPNTGLGRWSEDDIARFLKTGRNDHAAVFGSMTEAFNNSTQFLTDADLRAMAVYLKSLPGDPARDGTPWEYNPATNEALTLANRVTHPGAAIYMARCASCHGADGRGQVPWIPPLAGSSASLAPVPDSTLNVTLNGSMRSVADGVPNPYRMPPFRVQLSDQEIADVVSFIRTGWGNTGGEVTAEQVAAMRAHTDPASPDVIVLQMR